MRNIFSTRDKESYWDDAIELLKREEGIAFPTDDEIKCEIDNLIDSDWDIVREELKSFFKDGKAYLIVGECGLWDGKFKGGKLVYGYDGVRKAWAHDDYWDFEIYEVNKGGYGEFHVKGYHHDGCDHWVVKEVTEDGEMYYERNKFDHYDKELHERMWKSSRYTKNLNFCKSTWGF